MTSFVRFRPLLLGALASLTLAGCGLAVPLPSPGAPGAVRALAETLVQFPRIFPAPVKPPRHATAVIAHRGYSKVAPENTLAAFEAGIQAGADAIELDVRPTKDGHLVVIHDESVKRTTDGEGKVSSLTLEQVKQLDAGAWFDARFVGERVPTLDEALALIKGRANVVVEIKVKDRERVPRQVVEALDRHGVTPHAMVISFYGAPLEVVRDIAPHVPSGALVLPTSNIPNRALSTRASTAVAYWRAVDAGDIKAVRANQLKVYAWTVNDQAHMKSQAALGVDGLITDDVGGARRVLDQLAATPDTGVGGELPASATFAAR